jgi:hypothetical protein
MSILAKILSMIPKPDGISMGIDVPFWEVDGIQGESFPDFIRALPDLFPPGAILYLEDTSSPKVIDFLSERATKEISKVAIGTIWPKPRFFHVPVTNENMTELAKLAESCATPEVCIHLHVYRNGRVLLGWQDAFTQPLRISADTPEERLRSFCVQLNCQYKIITPVQMGT